jgi:hypothetical protein
MKRLAFVASFLALTSIGATCGGGGGSNSFTIKDKELDPGGVYVAYNLGCEAGCDQIQKGDLIQKMDGTTVKAVADLEKIADGKPHKLDIVAKDTKAAKSVEITASPKNNLPPLKDTPPFWLASAEDLKKTPTWARRRMFGHASPMVMLVSSDGGILDGRQLYGQKRFMVYWDWGDRVEEAAAVDFMQVLQKAQGDLKAKNIDIMFVHIKFPTGRKAPMNDTDLRAWQKKWAVKEGGRSLDPLPFYRFPNETEFNAARELGMENAYTVRENLGGSPAILLLDERGIVRWHSEGIVDPQLAEPEVKDPEQSTIIAAVKFALNQL